MTIAVRPNAARRVRTLALAGLLTPPLFTTLVVVHGLLLPDYSHVAMPISALATWPPGWIQVLNFYFAATLLIAFAFGLNMGIQPARGGALSVGS